MRKAPLVQVDPAVFKRYPSLKIGLIHIHDINNHIHLEQAHHLLEDMTRYIHSTFHPDTIKTHKLISPWVVAQRELNLNAVHYQTIVESLLQDVLRGRSICANDTATELVRYLSLEKLVPMSVEDPSKTQGSITYALAQGHEKKNILRKLAPGTLYHKDSKSIIGTHFDYWKPRRVLPVSSTKSILIHVLALDPITPAQLGAILDELEDLIIEFCGGVYDTQILSKTKHKTTWC
ncbi:hypothetical protein HYV86_06855 [Candidatus Woesearchaeota archaeon]|nr:hypothetical protein [Candidatus Woesearchaeota archaeon]